MRDYSNGGFFFINAAPIQAAGEIGLKIENIFSDAGRAVKGGKMFVLTNVSVTVDSSAVQMSSIPIVVGPTEDSISGSRTVGGFTINLTISDEDVILLEIIED